MFTAFYMITIFPEANVMVQELVGHFVKQEVYSHVFVV
jgi:hypothetical protein